MTPLEDENKHDPAEWHHHEKDRSCLRKATASREGKS